ncbi:Uncharacterised protein [BD1-7 clade bacterium]|nr:Uncharacterised protein [BD1-7 clade bacterium]
MKVSNSCAKTDNPAPRALNKSSSARKTVIASTQKAPIKRTAYKKNMKAHTIGA